jgi:DNA primase
VSRSSAFPSNRGNASPGFSGAGEFSSGGGFSGGGNATGGGDRPNFGDFKLQVLAATDIVQLIGRSVSLKRRGKDFVGLCPFHTEKSPSFTVSPSKQFFHCYGCKKGGNAIDFIIERDRIDFKEAMRLLAREANLEMPEFTGNKEKASQRQGLYDAHSQATQYFIKNLADAQVGKAGRDYLQKRGFTPETIQKFQIGLAVDAWDGLATSPLMRKFPAGELAVAGLLKPRNNGPGHYDTFRDRLMFPIRDEGGRIIAFGGRVMPGSEDPAKYLNSPETPLFSKGRCIYGLDFARPAIVSGAVRTAIIVEGYTDVVMAHQFGVANVVSVLGTALTEQHVHLLRRFADRIVLLFDGDAAGGAAADRTLELFLTQPIEIAIASLPPGVDPDEMFLQHGAAGFMKVIDSAVDALKYKWKSLESEYAATGDLTGRQKAIEQYLGALAAARGSGPIDPIRWGQAIANVSRLTDIPAAALHARFKGGKNGGGRGNVRYNRPGATGGGYGVKVSQGNGPTSSDPHGEQWVKTPTVRTARDRAENAILASLLHDPSQWMAVQAQICPDDFTTDVRHGLAEIYWEHQRHEGEPVFSQFLALLDIPQRELAMTLSSEAESTPQTPEAMAGNVEYLLEQRQRGQERKHLADLRRMSEGDSPAGNSVDSPMHYGDSHAESPENRQNLRAAPLTDETERLPYATTDFSSHAIDEAGTPKTQGVVETENPEPAQSKTTVEKNNFGEASTAEAVAAGMESLKLRQERARKPDLRRVGS